MHCQNSSSWFSVLLAFNNENYWFQYASVLMGLSNTFATIPGIVSPNLTGSLVPDRVCIVGIFE